MELSLGKIQVLLAGTMLSALGTQPAFAQQTHQHTGSPQAAAAPGSCRTELIEGIFASEPNTKVRLVKAFAKGEPMTLTGDADAVKSPADLCVVKLIVGPGNPGPAGAPSTSEGVGIEIWLPTPQNWNSRIHNVGSGGVDGVKEISSLTKLGSSAPLYFNAPALIAGTEGAVSAISDSGHVSADPVMGTTDASFLMNPDRSINKVLAEDYAGRALHLTAEHTKMLVRGFYGRPADYAYFTGCSNGGRQGHKLAQDYPEAYDGILSGAPAINLTEMVIGGLYPTIVLQQDLGGNAPTEDQFNFVSAAAVSACDSDITGQHSGYIGDPAMCRYNPLKDPKVLCTSEGGQNGTAQCLTRVQAKAINKIWYGQTIDGSVPDPAVSVGQSPTLDRKQLWYGVGRGTRLVGPAPFAVLVSKDGKVEPFQLATHFAAVVRQDPSIAAPGFRNASGGGMNGWKSLGYADLADITKRARELQDKLGQIDTNNPDLSGFKASGGKLLAFHGTADPIIPMEGTDRYYESVAKKMGGIDSIKGFYRYFQVPAFGHCFGVGQVDGLAGVSPKADPPLPAANQFFDQLVAWVEQGKTPDRIELQSVSGKSSRPVCPYPQKVRYKGGNPASASSFVCKKR